MITRAADYGRACEAKQDLENKITVKEKAAKRARESIEEQQQKLKAECKILASASSSLARSPEILEIPARARDRAYQ